MSDQAAAPFHNWISQCTQIPGVLGSGIHLPDGSILCQSTAEFLSDDKLESLIRRLAAWEPRLTEALKGYKTAFWRFEKANIRCDWRPDGAMAFVMLRQDCQETSRLDSKMCAFMTLS